MQNNIFKNLFGANKQNEKQFSVKIFEKIISEIKAETTNPCIKISIKSPTTSIFGSKIGGLPYIPHNEIIPVDLRGLQMKLLAQINFEEIHNFQYLPSYGIIQFFLSTNRLFGLNAEEPVKQVGFCIKYYKYIDKTVTMDEIKHKIVTTENSNRTRFPLKKESFSLDFLMDKDFISANDFRFEELFISKVKTYCPKYNIESLFDLSQEQRNTIFSIFSGSGSKICGFPRFAQHDPRESAEKNLKEFDTLLLQLDSDNENIDWGDSGVGNFFINKKNLINHDFSNILYNWDCF